MNMIKHINRKATWKHIALLFCTSILLGTCIVTMFFGQIKLSPDAVMDSQSFYTGEVFFENLDIHGEEGRKSYLLLHLLDYLFITQFYSLLVYLTSFLTGKVSDSGILYVLFPIPIFSAAMDLLENILIDMSILMYPEKIMMIGRLSGIFTGMKMYSIYIVFLIIIILLFLILIKALKKRRLKHE